MFLNAENQWAHYKACDRLIMVKLLMDEGKKVPENWNFYGDADGLEHCSFFINCLSLLFDVRVKDEDEEEDYESMDVFLPFNKDLRQYYFLYGKEGIEKLTKEIHESSDDHTELTITRIVQEDGILITIDWIDGMFGNIFKKFVKMSKQISFDFKEEKVG